MDKKSIYTGVYCQSSGGGARGGSRSSSSPSRRGGNIFSRAVGAVRRRLGV